MLDQNVSSYSLQSYFKLSSDLTLNSQIKSLHIFHSSEIRIKTISLSIHIIKRIKKFNYSLSLHAKKGTLPRQKIKSTRNFYIDVDDVRVLIRDILIRFTKKKSFSGLRAFFLSSFIVSQSLIVNSDGLQSVARDLDHV